MKSLAKAGGERSKQSLPVWEYGLKCREQERKPKRKTVTPRVGVWIEIIKGIDEYNKDMSLPVWECGLKYRYADDV